MEDDISKRRKKKILFLITKSNFGGAQRYVYDLATTLDAEKYDVVVATGLPAATDTAQTGGSGELIHKLSAAGITTRTISSLQRDVSLGAELRAIKEIDTIIRSEQPDVLHLNSSKAGILGTILGRIRFVPRIVFTAHGWAFNEDRPLWQRLLIKTLHWLTVVLSHRTIAVSQTLTEQLKWPGAASKMTVIHNGRRTPDFYTHNEARNHLCMQVPGLTTARDAFWSVTIGELHPVKQHDITIRALAAVKNNLRSFRHVIIGAGSEKNTLQQLIDECGMHEHIILAGSIDEAATLLPAFDLFVLSSRSEGYPYVIAEACQAGLPIIASRTGGIPEMITGGQEGILFSPGNIDALAAAYRTFATDAETRTTYAAASAARAPYFTIDRMRSETEAVYTN